MWYIYSDSLGSLHIRFFSCTIDVAANLLVVSKVDVVYNPRVTRNGELLREFDKYRLRASAVTFSYPLTSSISEVISSSSITSALWLINI